MAHRAQSAIFEHRAMDVATVKVTSRDIPPFRLAVTSDGSTDPGPRDPAAFLSPEEAGRSAGPGQDSWLSGGSLGTRDLGRRRFRCPCGLLPPGPCPDPPRGRQGSRVHRSSPMPTGGARSCRENSEVTRSPLTKAMSPPRDHLVISKMRRLYLTGQVTELNKYYILSLKNIANVTYKCMCYLKFLKKLHT